jgi:hypothetical protein
MMPITVAFCDMLHAFVGVDRFEKARVLRVMLSSLAENLTRGEVASMFPLVHASCLSTPVAIIFPTFAITSGVVTSAERTT